MAKRERKQEGRYARLGPAFVSMALMGLAMKLGGMRPWEATSNEERFWYGGSAMLVAILFAIPWLWATWPMRKP